MALTLNDDAVVLPGRGTALIAPPGTAFTAANLDSLRLDADPVVIPASWLWIGHTSSDNNVALSKSGGDKTTKGSWWSKALRTTIADIDWDVVINALQVQTEILELAFPGGALNSTSGVFEIPDTISTVEKALLVYIQDGSQHMGLYWPKVSISVGDAPSIDPENFFEIQLSGRAMSYAGKRWGIIPPRPIPTT